MSRLEDQLIEDRRLRDAARAVLVADLEHARTSFSSKGLADRVGTRIGDGAVDVFETAKAQASDNRGIIAALIGALLLWLGREPILEALGLGAQTEDEGIEGEADSADTADTPLPGDDHEH